VGHTTHCLLPCRDARYHVPSWRPGFLNRTVVKLCFFSKAARVVLYYLLGQDDRKLLAASTLKKTGVTYLPMKPTFPGEEATGSRRLS
jgi:hypothetical protein